MESSYKIEDHFVISFVFPLPTYFMTKIPRFVAALISMLSTPVPALPINFSLVPALMTASVTLVADLTIKQSKS